MTDEEALELTPDLITLMKEAEEEGIPKSMSSLADFAEKRGEFRLAYIIRAARDLKPN